MNEHGYFLMFSVDAVMKYTYKPSMQVIENEADRQNPFSRNLAACRFFSEGFDFKNKKGY